MTRTFVTFGSTILLSACLISTSVHAATAEELIVQAQAAYAARDYDAAGAQKAQDAADLYSEAAKTATITNVKSAALVGLSEALNFVATASDVRDVKLEKYLAGIEAADAVVKAAGISDVTAIPPADIARLKALPAAELSLVVEALYMRGVNLGQWATVNGIAASLGRWPELRSLMETVVTLGGASVHEYGPYRVLGRGNAKIPETLGGSAVKADKYLSTAWKNTLSTVVTTISTNGYNNIYLAELFKAGGKLKEATDLMNALISADVAAVKPPLVPEFVRAQKEAAEILKTW